MSTSWFAMPRFRRGQIAYFIGGKGVIKNYQPEAGSWSYIIEMEMGPDPEIGRLGSETTFACLKLIWSNWLV